jgi:hypothetical protein
MLSYLGLLTVAGAHEIPNDVQVKSFLRQDDTGLTLLFRVPMSAMKEVEFPLINHIYLDIPQVKPSLLQAAELWFTDNLQIVQGQQALKQISVKAVRISLPSDRSFATYDQALAHVLSENWALPSQLVWS